MNSSRAGNECLSGEPAKAQNKVRGLQKVADFSFHDAANFLAVPLALRALVGGPSGAMLLLPISINPDKSIAAEAASYEERVIHFPGYAAPIAGFRF